MMVKSFSITFIILSFVVIISLYSNLSSFIDIHSLWIVLVPTLFLLGVGMKRKDPMTSLIKGRGISWLELIGYVAVILCVIGSHMGMVGLYENFGDKTMVGPAFAVLVLTSFYGILIFFICFLLGHHQLKKVAVYFVLGQTLILVNNMLGLALSI